MEARILGPAMLKAGYTNGYTCATIAVGALITATIPPSIGLILYGFMGNVSIGQLFAGGIIPGLLMTVFLMFTAWVIARKRGYMAASDRLPTAWEVACSIWECKWALLFPVFLILGIRYGIFTPSEAGASWPVRRSARMVVTPCTTYRPNAELLVFDVWACISKRPGIRYFPVPSTTLAPSGTLTRADGPSSAMRPLRMTTD